MGKIIWNCSSWKTRSNSVKEVGLKKVNESYLLVISFVLFIETKGSPPRTTQCQSLVKERKIILFLKQLQGYGSSKPIFILFYSFVLLFFFDSHITCTLVLPRGLNFVAQRCLHFEQMASPRHRRLMSVCDRLSRLKQRRYHLCSNTETRLKEKFTS